MLMIKGMVMIIMIILLLNQEIRQEYDTCANRVANMLAIEDEIPAKEYYYEK